MASLLSKVAEAVSPNTLPTTVEERLVRGRKRLLRLVPLNNERLRFWRGDHYVYIDGSGFLVTQGTVTNADGSGKPRHRVRTTRNLIFDHVSHEVSSATSRVPSYDVLPSSTDPRRVDAALLSEKVALYGHEKWHIPLAVEKVVTYAVVCGEGFAWPYFDNTKGNPIDGKVSTGEICIRTFGPNEVYWEPGVRFEDARWYCVEQARSIDEVKDMEGYSGGNLKPDANISDLAGEKEKRSENLVMVSEYLERPSPKNPNGQWIVSANKKQIVPARDYPCSDASGRVQDEPVLLKLSYAMDPGSDRDMGLVQHLLDAQRTYNDCVNKSLEAKNLALVLQVLALPGAIRQRLNDEPGAVFEVADLNAVKFRDPPSPELFNALRLLGDDAKADMARIAAQNDIPNQVEAGNAIQVLIERDSTRRANFLANLARFYSELMHVGLGLVQRYYTEQRLIKIQGSNGVETIDGFKGADLCDEIDVRVLPSSIEPRTREALEQKVNWYMQMGFISPEMGIAAVQAGSADDIVRSYEIQVRQQQREIQQMAALAGTLSEYSTPQDFAKAGIPLVKPWNNHRIHIAELTSYMSSAEFEALPMEVQSVFENHMDQHKAAEQAEAMQQIQQQTAMAQTAGMSNAAAPQGAKPMPSAPSPKPPGAPPTQP